MKDSGEVVLVVVVLTHGRRSPVNRQGLQLVSHSGSASWALHTSLGNLPFGLLHISDVDL